MKIELTGYELEDALKQYLSKVFKKNISKVSVRESEYVICYVTIDSDSETITSVDEDEPVVIEIKPKRTRRKVEKSEPNVQEVQVTAPLSENSEDSENEEDKSTHYANLPELNAQDKETYINLLSLLNNNPRNKNRVKIEELVSNASSDLAQVILANQSYQDWLAMCVELDADTVAQTVINNGLNTVAEAEESLEERNLRLMKKVCEEAEEEEEEKDEQKSLTENPSEKTTLFSNNANSPQSKGTPLFKFQTYVSQSGSLFPANVKPNSDTEGK